LVIPENKEKVFGISQAVSLICTLWLCGIEGVGVRECHRAILKGRALFPPQINDSFRSIFGFIGSKRQPSQASRDFPFA
jgi:hypothetical protein